MRATCELAWVDVETTGLDPERHELLEVAVVRTTAGLEELDSYSTLVLPEHLEEADPRALELVRYSPVEWSSSAVPLREAMERVCLELTGATLAGQNVGFDRGFLVAGAARARVPWPRMDHHHVDVMALAWPLLAWGRVRSLSLAALAEALGVERQGPAHRAEGDIRTTIEVARRLLARWDGAERAERQAARLAAELEQSRSYAVGLVREMASLQESLARADEYQRSLARAAASEHNELTALRAQLQEAQVG